MLNSNIVLYTIVIIFVLTMNVTAQEEFKTTHNLPTSNAPLPDIPTISGTTYDAVDVKVFESPTRNQAEPSIASSPFNLQQYLAGAYTGDAGSKKLGYYYSTSGPSVSPWLGSNDLPVALTYSADPVVAYDADGAAYYCYINGNSDGFGINYYTYLKKSTNGGATWSITTQIPGSLKSDKPWLAIDQSSSAYKNRSYVAWSDFSNPFGDKFKAPIEFCSSALSNSKFISDSGRISKLSQGVSLATGPNGELYAVWAGYDTYNPGTKDEAYTNEKRLVFNKSTDGGATWAVARKIVDVNGIRGEWNDKNNVVPPLPPIRVNSFPSMAVDVGDGPNRGEMYVTWADQSYDRSSIFLIKSTNGGETWLGFDYNTNQIGPLGGDYIPFVLNDDIFSSGYNDQWFPAITVNPYGVVTVIFYDSREDANNQYTSVWAARSTNGGTTWSNFRISDVQFQPVPVGGTTFMGDYISITSQPGKTTALWNDTREGNNPGRLYQLYANVIDTWSIDQTFAPVKPKQLSASAYNDDGINCPRVTWAANPEPNLLRYRVERSINTSGGPPGTYSQIATVSAGTISYIDYGLSYGSGNWKVYYRVKAENTSNLISAPSDVLTVNSSGFYKQGGELDEQEVPKHFSLLQNYPNPFNPVSTIHYTIPKVAHVSLKVFDLLGREVTALVNKIQMPGNYAEEFNATNLPSGVYLYRLQAGDFISMRKMVLQK